MLTWLTSVSSFKILLGGVGGKRSNFDLKKFRAGGAKIYWEFFKKKHQKIKNFDSIWEVLLEFLAKMPISYHFLVGGGGLALLSDATG